ncbi:MAG: iron-containing alcohol dehydrogenase family protein [Ardenticatenaceae bacterium]
MYKNNIFENMPNLLYGDGRLAQLGDLLHQLSLSKVLIVTDPGIVAAGIVERVVESLSKAHIRHVIFDEVEPNPSLQTAELIAVVYQEENCEGIVAVGGGSAMDAAKGGGLFITNDGQLYDFADGAEIPNSLPPLVAIPTTVGTGSEVTKFAVLTDYDACQKLMFTGDVLIPTVAILDPQLVRSLPSHLVAATGMDALTHAIEAMLSVLATPESDAFAHEAIGLMTHYLPTAVHADCNSEEGQTARGQMLYASTLAALALNKALVGLVHGMSHPLTSYAGIPHGLANALLLPDVLIFNAPACAPALARVAHAMGKGSQPEAAIYAVQQLNTTLDLPSTLSELGVTEQLIPYMAQEAFESGNAQIINPRKPTFEEVVDLYQQLL